jgi:hypothetical protein
MEWLAAEEKPEKNRARKRLLEKIANIFSIFSIIHLDRTYLYDKCRDLSETG